MKNIDNCPDELVNLLQTKSFNQLKEEEKELVLSYLSQEEYENYFYASNSLKVLFDEDETVPEKFHQFFSEQKKPKQFVLQLQAWHLAASFILISSLWIWSLKLKSKPEMIVQNVHDTIYLSNANSPEISKIYDTIFIHKNIITERKSKTFKKDTAAIFENKSNEEIQINQLNALRNKRKNKGIKGDSLLKNFEFVRI